MSPTFSLLGHKSPPVIEVKAVVGKVGKEERKGAAQEKKVPGIRDKEEKKGAKTPGKEVCAGVICALDGTVGRTLGVTPGEPRERTALPQKLSRLGGLHFFMQERLNSKKQKTKDDKKVVKSTSRDRLSSEDPTTDSTVPSQEPIDPLVMEKYTQRLHAEVKGRGDRTPPSPHTCIFHSLYSTEEHLPLTPPPPQIPERNEGWPRKVALGRGSSRCGRGVGQQSG